MQRHAALLQEISHRRIGFEANRALVGLVSGLDLAGTRQ
jgi:hypothetical protein